MPIDNAGNSKNPSDARHISLSTSQQSWSDWVGNGDKYDYYIFTLSSESTISGSVSGTTAEIDLYLFNIDGWYLAGTDHPGPAGDSRTGVLPAGTYYIGVSQSAYANGASTNYKLNLSAIPTKATPSSVISGGSGNDELAGTNGNDTIVGGSGNDLLDGSTGADKLDGGSGDDIYIVDEGDVVIETTSSGDDAGGWDIVKTALPVYSLATIPLVEGLYFIGATGNFMGTGNSLSNVLQGGTGNDTLFGGLGDDAIAGGGGNDRINGGFGDDALGGGSGDDTLLGLEGDDTLAGGAGNDSLNGGNGLDSAVLTGNRGDYLIQRLNAANTQIRIARRDASGTETEVDLFSNIESVKFGDGTVGQFTLDDLLKNTASIFDDRYEGGTGDDVFDGLAGNDILLGGAGKDNLYGGAGTDTLDGGAGADTLVGGLGDDVYVADNSGDLIQEDGSQGIDTILTSLAQYTLSDNVEKLVFTGQVDDKGVVPDFIASGNALGDVITGGGGNDRLDGGEGSDTLIGGAGDDTYIVDSHRDKAVESANDGTDTIRTGLSDWSLTDTVNVENLTYTGSDRFYGVGNAANNTLTGGAGNDTLLGLEGDDTLAGGAGNDSLNGGNGLDSAVLTGNRGDYLIQRLNAANTQIRIARRDASGTETEVDLFSNIESVKFGDGTVGQFTLDDLLKNTASIFDDRYEGGTGDDVFDGLAGNDTLIGGSGDDTLFGGLGGDIVDGGFGADSMAGGKGDDTYIVDLAAAVATSKTPAKPGDIVVENANEGTDTVLTVLNQYALTDHVERLVYTGQADAKGGALTFTGTGNILANTLSGGAGNDTLDGGEGADWLIGGTGDDTYVVDDGGDKVVEATDAGTDAIISKLASYTLTDGSNIENLSFGGSGNFVATGNKFDNVLIGGGGDDILRGRAGNDTLDGGAGNNWLAGGDGVDTVLFKGSLNDYQTANKSGNLVFTRNGESNTLVDIEKVVFDNGTAVTSDDSAMDVGGAAFPTVHPSTWNYYADVAKFAQAAYFDDRDGQEAWAVVTGVLGWQPVNLHLAQVKHPGQYVSGNAQAAVFSGTYEGKKTLVLAYRGTDPSSPADWAIDALMLMTGIDVHFPLMSSLNDAVIQFAKTNGVEKVIVAGHSLGGSMVERFMGEHSGDSKYVGVTFGSFGIPNATLQADGRITQFEHMLDPVAGLQDHTGATTIHMGTPYWHSIANYVQSVGTAASLALPFLTPNGQGEVRTQGDYYVNFDPSETKANPSSNTINGGHADELILGRFGNDTLNGGYGDDTLDGGSALDALNGGPGNDFLTGGPSPDRFVFDTSFSGAQNVDAVTDFLPGQDKIVLDNDIFTGLTWSLLSSVYQNADSDLKAEYFRKGSGVTSAGDMNDRIILDTKSGTLYYDADGTGFLNQPIPFAIIQKSALASISAADFFVID